VQQLASPSVLRFEFLDNFRKEYQRNNKARGKKHFRCFPNCRKDEKTGQVEHIATNYCGQPVTIAVTCRCTDEQISSFVAYACFRLEESPQTIAPGVRTSDRPDTWIPGKVSRWQKLPNGTTTLYIAFNSENNAWSYQWQGHRMTAKKLHVLEVFMGTADRSVPSPVFNCCANFCSPSFTVFCRAKDRLKPCSSGNVSHIAQKTFTERWRAQNDRFMAQQTAMAFQPRPTSNGMPPTNYNSEMAATGDISLLLSVQANERMIDKTQRLQQQIQANKLLLRQREEEQRRAQNLAINAQRKR
jgi:hypothetical protein